MSFGGQFKQSLADYGSMATKETAAVPTRDETKRFLVDCDGCSYEQAADGREEATRIGADHRHATGHELVALELPRSVETA